MNYGIGVTENGEENILKKLWKYWKDIKKDLVIFDVGANIWQYSTLVDTHISKKVLHSFEPSKKTFSELSLNTKDFLNTSIHNFGLSDKSQVLTLYYEGENVWIDDIHSCASIYPDNITSYISKHTASEQVELRTLDDFCEESNIDHIDFLKLDIEWHELACLQGAQKMLQATRIDMIQIELNRCAISSRVFLRDYWDLLSPNYNIYRMLSWSHGIYKLKKYETCLENFTFMNYICIAKNSPLNSVYQ